MRQAVAFNAENARLADALRGNIRAGSIVVVEEGI
jgi:hypothetical protein